MNILLVSSYYKPSYIYGGPVEAMHNLSLSLQSLGLKIETYTTTANGTADLSALANKTILVDGLPVTYFPRWWFGMEKKPFTLFLSPALGRRFRNLKETDFDLIILHAAWGDPGRLVATAARMAGIPYIYYTHGCYEPWAFRHKQWKKQIYWELIEKKILARAAGIIVCNEAETAQLRALGIRTPIRRIPWGVELPDSSKRPSREKLEMLFHSLSGRPFILFLSRLHPKKGFDLLIPAFYSLAQAFPEWLLVLAGPDEGGQQAVLESMVKEASLTERVIFTGMVTGEAKEALLSNAGVFVLPSYSEGFPMVVAEAIGYGNPAVITETCYVPEVEKDGAGLVVKPNRAHLTCALRNMLQDNNFRRNCAARAPEVARQHFSWEAIAEKSLLFYREVVQCRYTV